MREKKIIKVKNGGKVKKREKGKKRGKRGKKGKKEKGIIVKKYFYNLPSLRSGIEPLLPDDFGDEALAGIKFAEEFTNRYGQPSPHFFPGSRRTSATYKANPILLLVLRN